MRIFDFLGAERRYFIALPGDFDEDTRYWPLVAVHGGGGNARSNSKAIVMRHRADELDLPVIMVMPEFVTVDKQVSRFPLLGEAAFLKALLGQVHSEFYLQEKILLYGYSMGGQFAHRFALSNPGLVQACAAFAAGTWSTPDGRLLIEDYGEVKNPGVFLSDRGNARKVPERLRDMFDERTAEIAGLPASAGAENVPFLVMCGTIDSRYGIAVEFASCMKEMGYKVETAWPRTPHSSKSGDFEAEFLKFPEEAVRFFKRHATGM